MAKQKTEEQKQIETLKDTDFICVAKCFFNSVLWKPGDCTGYIDGIKDSPYFKQV